MELSLLNDKEKINKIKNASRSPYKNSELPDLINSLNHNSKTKKWTLSHDSFGPCIELNFSFTSIDKIRVFSDLLENFQAKIDHHANIQISNNNLCLQVNTHQPVPGITPVDFLFCATLNEILNEY